jgi:hypothetical protein
MNVSTISAPAVSARKASSSRYSSTRDLGISGGEQRPIRMALSLLFSDSTIFNRAIIN